MGIAGRAVEGNDEYARICELGGSALPPYPSATVIPPVKIPSPQPLTTGMTEIDMVRALALAYRGAVKVCYRQDSWFMARGCPTRNKAWGKLATFAPHLFDAKIPPAGWAHFSVHSWRAMSLGQKPATVAWVYNLKRFETQREWYERETDLWAGRRERLSQAHGALLLRHQQMWRELLAQHPPDRPSVLAIIENIFPRDTYERMVGAARGANLREQIRVDEHLANGGTHWTL